MKIKALRVNLSPRAPKDDYSQINLNYVFRSRPVNGACGQDNGAALSAVPVNLCRSGTASAVAGIGPWSWSCKGLKGGATASCRAKKNEINIKILSNGTSIMTPADVTLYAGQPVSISITSDVMKIDKEIVFFPTNKDGDQTGYGELYSLKLCKDYIKFYSVEVCPLNQIKVTFTPPKSWLGVYDIRLNVWERWFSTNVAAGKDIRLNIKVKNDDLLGKIDQGKCVGVINNGDSSNKLDIVFVADGYADISKFTNDVNQLIQTLLTPEPLKSNSKGINFYRIDRIGSLQPAGVDPFTGPAPFYWKDMVAKCAGYDLVAVIKNTTTSTPKAYFDDNPKWLFTGMNWPLSTIIHEFGHAFADLGDEYANLGTVFFSTDSIWGRVNIDKTGCPKWCSGNVNTGATIESAIYHEQDQTREKCTFNCYDAYQKVNECLKSKGIINGGFDSSFECWRSAQTDNKKCQADASQCNFGVDCRDNLGCYWNARAINTFKSTATSAMQDSSLSIYNSISQKAILNELKKYIK
ncbi:MAG: M64 family metallopeptidase [bacterium]|nr:M64 family metallopeptidase [bacterium]